MGADTSPADVHCFATEYTVCALHRTHPDFPLFCVTVEWRGSIHPDRLDTCWAVCHLSRCLNDAGQWDYELPSSRTDEWISHHRFSLDRAVELAATVAPHITVNGLTPRDVRRPL